MSVPLFTPSYLSLYLASKTLDMDYFCVLRESAYNYINTFYEQSQNIFLTSPGIFVIFLKRQESLTLSGKETVLNKQWSFDLCLNTVKL